MAPASFLSSLGTSRIDCPSQKTPATFVHWNYKHCICLVTNKPSLSLLEKFDNC